MIWVLSFVFRKLPLGWALAVGRALGWFWFYVIPVRRRVAINNIRRALGDTLSRSDCRKIARRSFEHLAMMAVESLRSLDMTPELSRELVRRDNYERYERARARGKGVILAMAHIGNFEMLASSQGVLGEPVNAVVKDIKAKAVHEFVFEVRRRTGYKTIPPRRSKEQIRATLARNEIVALLVDQHLPQHRAMVCEFFGQLAATTPAPARFALETGAPIIPAVVFRDPERPGHHVLRLEEELEIERVSDDPKENLRHNTERLNRIIEGWIRERPDLYFWVHKRWKVQDNPEGWEIPAALRHLLPEEASHVCRPANDMHHAS